MRRKTADKYVGDISNWMDPDTGAFNQSGLVENMKLKAGSFYGKAGPFTVQFIAIS